MKISCGNFQNGVNRMGNSVGTVIPKSIRDTFNLEAGHQVEIRIMRLLVRPKRRAHN